MFWHESPDLGGGGGGGAHFGSNSPLDGTKLQSNAWGMPLGGKGSFELTGTYNLDTHVKRDK